MVNDKQIPQWLGAGLSLEQAEKVSTQISLVESKTRAELVAVVAPRSSAVAHVPWILMLIFGSLFILVEGAFWGMHMKMHWEYVPVIAVVVIYFLSMALAKVSYVQRILTPNVDEAWQVQQRAELEFYRAGITKTSEGTGVLIFVSWMEKRAVILADQGVAQKCPESVWKEVIDQMLTEFKKGSFHSGLERAISQCGDILIKHLPAEGSKPSNQLSNHLIIRD